MSPRRGERCWGAALASIAALWSIAALGLPSSAAAATRIGTDRIVVHGEGASATITRSPFSIEFRDARGQTVLAEVPNAKRKPLLVPPTLDPEPLGLDALDGPTLYAPLSFAVGVRRNLQWPAQQWVGDQLAGLEAGVQYSARDVIGAVRQGDGVRLTLATSDPSGRRMLVTVTPGPAGSVAVSARLDRTPGVVAMADSFASSPGEAFHGFGGRHNALDQRGSDFYNWLEQENVGAGPLQPIANLLPGGGGDRYLFPNGPTAGYYVQSQFISNRGYGFLLDRDELSGWRMASDRADAWQVDAAAPALDYLVAPGAPAEAVGKLTAIGGRQPVPPDWALGPQLDRAVLFSGDSPANYQAEVLDDLDQIERLGLPLRAYRIEGWEFLDRDFLRQVIDRLHGDGIRALLYFRGFVGQDQVGTDSPARFREAVANGYVATTASGRPYLFLSNFNALGAVIDFTDPAAVAWWQGRIREALDLGADGFMQDFGEQVLYGMHFDDGETGATMHNRYPKLFHRATAEEVARYEDAHPGRSIWYFTRSGYSGTPGSAPFEGGNFPGDETTDWSRSSGLASLAPDMLNRGVGGAYGFGTDIGGFADIHTPPTTKELFIRWAEWAALSPIMRLHGSVVAGTHTPWSYDEQTVRIYDALSRLHLAAAPLIRRLWREAERTGIPVARPLWLQYPGDPAAADQDQEWMLGPDVLVAPVVEPGAVSREVYFPAGCWTQPETGETFSGPSSSVVDAPLERLPYFLRCGTSPLQVAR